MHTIRNVHVVLFLCSAHRVEDTVLHVNCSSCVAR